MIRSKCRRKLVTLRDAGHVTAVLPKREHDAPEWQAVKEGGPTMFARIGIMRALTAAGPIQMI
ncbi:hypothetical protein [Bradyrhizobium liaoningense]|uniref:hypothetical protein n=1 Tax=Bradyrhizobium liaoningense TaxID=43992 RepID=UPI00289C0C5E|nr:hypothetical protein [Bradyrhizobium liaoningense]